MNAPTPSETPSRTVVLVGAGQANLLFLRMWRKMPIADVAVTLINPTPEVLYSAMVPGFLMGEYDRAELTIDVARLCRRAGARFVQGVVTRVRAKEKVVEVEGRLGAIHYDVCLLAPGGVGGTRPIEQVVQAADSEKTIAIVGGGAAGCELAIALAIRRGGRVRLYERADRLLPTAPPKAGKFLAKHLQSVGVEVLLGKNAPESNAETIDTRVHSAPAFVRASGLPVDEKGFLRAGDDSLVEGTENLFAAGDSIARSSDVPRGGVSAVRGGKVAAENVRRWLQGRSGRKRYRFPKTPLSILNLGRGQALAWVATYWFTGRFARVTKENLDRSWMLRWQMPGATRYEPDTMLCGGCGGKAPASHLQAVGLPPGDDVFFWSSKGTTTGLSTVDYFRDCLFDPYEFAFAAAVHAMGDCFAKGVAPHHALLLVQLPTGTAIAEQRILAEVVEGARAALGRDGTALGGGHTLRGPELAVGYAVYGETEAPLWPKGGLREGDRLYLTKPLGAGALLAAHARGALCGWQWSELRRHLRESPRDACAAMSALPVRSATDVTGFGFLGHLFEMLAASGGLGASIDVEAIPVLPAARALEGTRIRSSLHPANVEQARGRGIDVDTLPFWLFDPQTCGGLLFAVPNETTVGSFAQCVGVVATHASSQRNEIFVK